MSLGSDSPPQTSSMDEKSQLQAQPVYEIKEGKAGYDKKATQRLLRKMDFYLIPFLSLLYLLSFLDRSNIGNARLANLESTLHINPKSLYYNNALAIFFPFYVFIEIPSNIMMKATRPSLWIPFIMLVWGVTCIGMGFVQNYKSLMVARAFLGLAEGGLFPGVTFFITQWYQRHESGFRMAIFFSAATIAGAFGGLLARAIMLMEGMRGLAAWRWIFILEGIATVIVACFAFWAMYDYPDTAKFLTKDEKVEVARRLEEDRGCLDDTFKKQYIFDALKDWKIWIFCLITVGIFTPLYCVSLFLPTIVKGLGFTNNSAQLMTVPPYVVACLVTLFVGYAADKTKQRGMFIMVCILTTIIGTIMLLTSNNNHVKYGGTFLVASGIYPNVPGITCWNANNIGGSTKRSVGMAMQVGIGNLGGVLSAYMYLTKDAPKFKHGHTGLIGVSAMAFVFSAFMTVYLRWENSRRDKEFKNPAMYSQEDMTAEKEKGDKASFFRYTC